MRQHRILSRILLMLSIINFSIAAPAAIRERPEVRLDANVTRNVTAAPQKRGDPLDWGGAPNVPGLPVDYAPPPSPDLTDILGQMAEHLAEQYGYTDGTPPPSPHLSQLGPLEDRFPPGFSVNPDTLSSTGHQPTPPQSPTGGSPLSPLRLPHRGPSEDRFPGMPGWSVNSGTSSTGSTGIQPTPPQSPGADPEIHSLLNLEPFPYTFWDKLLKGKIKRRISGSDAVNLAQKDPRSRVF